MVGKSKTEMRMAARAKRKAEWEQFLKTKPDDDYVNPDDAQAITDAARNMGDYKLKSEKDFVPDETRRMTPEQKKQQVQISLRGNSGAPHISKLAHSGFHADSYAATRNFHAQNGVQRKVPSPPGREEIFV